VYFSFGTIADLVMSTQRSTQNNRIRVKVFFYDYFAPLMFALVVMFSLPGHRVFDYLSGGGIILGALIKIFFSKNMYITEMNFDNNLLKINYLNQFFRPGSKIFSLADISCMEVENANWLIDFSPVLNVKHKEEWVEFEIIDRTFKGIIQNNVEAANKGLEGNDAYVES
jgi:hypothetical protein